MTKVLIADDHPVVRAGLKELLSGAFGKLAFTEAKTAQETIEMASKEEWSLVILDVTHVTADVALACVAALHPDVQIVVASLDRNEIDVYRMSPDGLAREAELPSLLALPSEACRSRPQWHSGSELPGVDRPPPTCISPSRTHGRTISAGSRAVYRGEPRCTSRARCCLAHA